MKKKKFSPLLLFAALSAMANTPYINRVYEYCPAPGQFIGELPEVESDATEDQILAACEEQISGGKTPGLISLGAFGGYVTFGFDHSIVNVPGEYDFKVYGNAFASENSVTGSAEPGIVMVCKDTNGNGLPDDEWFELQGSEHLKYSLNRNFTVTYFKPDPDSVADPDPNSNIVVDRKYIHWKSNDSEILEGYLPRISSHTQSYWPQWAASNSQISFSGTLLPSNMYNKGTETEPFFVLTNFEWGYVDNYQNNDERNTGFDISNAVDAQNKPVYLDCIDFVRVYTGVCQSCGILGETSTEISGAEDLHPDAPLSVSDLEIATTSKSVIYDLHGKRVSSDFDSLPKGIYIVMKSGTPARKIIKSI